MKAKKKWNINHDQATILLIVIVIFLYVLFKEVAEIIDPELELPMDASMINKIFMPVVLALFFLFYYKSDLEICFDALKIKDHRQFKRSVSGSVLFSALLIIIMIVIRFYLNSKDPLAAARPAFGLYLGIHGRFLYPLVALFQEFMAKAISQHNLSLFFKKNKLLTVLVNSMIFAILHMSYPLYYLLGAFVLCIVTGFIYERDQHIYGCALIHFVIGFMPRALGLK